ncbi:MAG TPA: hypothetical protein VEH77_18275 [Roseiarcus sp.]|nr:hypothetical protein [Roseiarcus sp.]
MTLVVAPSTAYVQNGVTIPAGMGILPVTGSFNGNAAISATSVAATASQSIASGQSTVSLSGGSCGSLPSPGTVFDSTAYSYLGVATCASGTLTFPNNTLAAGSGSSDGLSVGPAISVASMPSSCQTGAMIYGLDGIGSFLNADGPLEGVVNDCGTAVTNKIAVFSAFTANRPAPSGADSNTTPNLLMSGPVASSDNCRFIYSMWWRGTGAPASSQAYETSYASDIVSGGTGGPITNPTGRSEQQRGLDLVFDNANGTSLRINYADSSVVPSSNNNHNVEETLTSPLKWINYGAWNHFLWSANTCETNTQYTQMAINGVPVNWSEPRHNTFNSAGVNFSNPGSGFMLAGGPGGDGSAQVSLADVYLWVGHDIVCNNSPTTCSGGAAGATLLSTDINNFGQQANVQTATLATSVNSGGSVSVSSCPVNAVSGQEVLDTTNSIFLGIAKSCSSGTVTMLSGLGAVNADANTGATVTFFNWVPNAPSVAVAAYGTPLVGCTGAAANFVSNCNANGSPATGLQAVNFWQYNCAGVSAPCSTAGDGFALTDLTSSASLVSASNHGGQPAHAPGYKWGCMLNTGGVSTISFSTCGDDIAVGDMLILVFSGKWNTASNAGACTLPSGFTAWTNPLLTTPYGFGMCVGYKIAASADVGQTSYSGSVVNATTNSVTTVLDYANVNAASTPDGSLASTPTFASATTMTAPGISGATGSNDLVVGIFEGWTAQYPTTCPTSLPNRRMDFTARKTTNPATVLICDSGTGITPPTSNVTATQATAQYGSGILLPLAAN